MPKKENITPSNSVTFQQRWCLEEDLQFLEAMRLVGYGKWTKISDVMGGTRTPLQVKNRARHLMMYEVDSPLAVELKALAASTPKSTSPRLPDYSPQTEFTLARSFNTKPTEVVNLGEIMLSEDDETFVDTDDVLSGTGEQEDGDEVVRADILALWESQKPLQISLEFLFQALPERNMEAVTAMYYKLEEENLINSDIPRRRRVRDEHGNWVEAGGEGRTIAHVAGADNKATKRRRITSSKPHKHDDADFELFEPIKVVDQAPLVVRVAEWILKVIEFHSMLSTNEIIGLLGGIVKESEKVIEVTTVFPCVASDANGMECEMDPLSEMQACEYFEERSVGVVGWYHSHPTFAPNPSKRDIDTQTMYQTVFTGGFVGVIVRPSEPASWSCFHVQNGQPYHVEIETCKSADASHDKEYMLMLSRAISPLRSLNIDDKLYKRLLFMSPNDQYKRLLASPW